MNNWISVKDELPESQVDVLAFVDCITESWQEVIKIYICPEYGNFTWESLDDEDFPAIVTHWQPLPEPPL